MNWLLIGLPLGACYLIWFGYLLVKKHYSKPLAFFGLAQLPYLFINLVAPFRGLFDADYAGYSIGWITLSQGIWVTVVVGAIVVSCFLLATKALSNGMTRPWWFLGFIVDGLLAGFIAIPILLDVATHLSDFTVELGEYLKVSGVWVALLIGSIFIVPTLWAFYYAGQKYFRPLVPAHL